jgi:hypothetical protein
MISTLRQEHQYYTKNCCEEARRKGSTVSMNKERMDDVSQLTDLTSSKEGWKVGLFKE